MGCEQLRDVWSLEASSDSISFCLLNGVSKYFYNSFKFITEALHRDPTGYSSYGEFQNGWDTTVLQNSIDACVSPVWPLLEDLVS